MTPTTLGLPTVRRDREPLRDGMPRRGPLVDTFGRVATDLRISLTDRCNLRCTYCSEWQDTKKGMSFEVAATLIRKALGFAPARGIHRC